MGCQFFFFSTLHWSWRRGGDENGLGTRAGCHPVGIIDYIHIATDICINFERTDTSAKAVVDWLTFLFMYVDILHPFGRDNNTFVRHQPTENRVGYSDMNPCKIRLNE